MVCGSIYISGANQQASTTIFRDSTNLGNATRGIVQYWDTGDLFQGNASMMLTDHPNTTNAVTYALYFRKLSSGGANVFVGVDSSTSFITLLEVQVLQVLQVLLLLRTHLSSSKVAIYRRTEPRWPINAKANAWVKRLDELRRWLSRG